MIKSNNYLQCEYFQESLDSLSLNCDSPLSNMAPTTCEGTSNIDPLQLQLDLRPFKSLSKLSFLGVSPTNLINLGSARKTIQQLIIRDTNISKVCDVLLCDDLHKMATEQIQEKVIGKFLISDFYFNFINLF